MNGIKLQLKMTMLSFALPPLQLTLQSYSLEIVRNMQRHQVK